MACDAQQLRRELEFLLGVPATDGNEVTLYRNGDEMFPAMREAIEQAESTVDMVIFAFRRGSAAEMLADAMSERARAGCKVRLLIDGVGSAVGDLALLSEMRDAGVEVARFRPPHRRSPFTHNRRTHRKVLVVDDEIAFTGGVGIAPEWEGDARGPEEWRDTLARLRGPAVAGLMAAFVQNWAEMVEVPHRPPVADMAPEVDGDQTVLVVRGRATVGWDDLQTAWHALLRAAEDEINLQTAYFTPDAHFLAQLPEAARRGVTVRLLVPGPHHVSSISRLAGERIFDSLLEAGVQVWVFQPTMLHTKVLTIDRTAAMLGSSNYNRRSMEQDEEVACVFLGGEVPAALAADFDEDLERAEQVDAQQWASRPAYRRLAERATAPIQRFL